MSVSALPTRVCLRCRRPMRGYSFRTYYGIWIDADGNRTAANGEALHDICPIQDVPRAVWHNEDEITPARAARRKYHLHREKTIEYGILKKDNGRYAVRIGTKRGCTYATLEEARAARDKVKT